MCNKMENEDLSYINIIYDIKRAYKYIDIFGSKFVKNNKNKCKMIIDNKEYEITEKYNIENYNNNELNIKLKGINNVIDMSGMFYGCSSLSSLSDISNWITNKATNMRYMFYECSSLSSLPDISKWNTNNVIDMSGMFYGCSSLSSLPDISNWITKNVTYMSYMFNKCPNTIFSKVTKAKFNKAL